LLKLAWRDVSQYFYTSKADLLQDSLWGAMSTAAWTWVEEMHLLSWLANSRFSRNLHS
jgi:hypothetical protein